jgi:hypothetical protein
MGDMTAAHFIFIPGVLLVGVVIGWILGSRAAHDALGGVAAARDVRAAQERAELSACGPGFRTGRSS